MTEFAAIPTMYKGVRFRSRLEAKWACCFDRLRLPWEYEPFDLNGWIPDFLVSGFHPGYYKRKPCLVDIKPTIGMYPDASTQTKIERAYRMPPTGIGQVGMDRAQWKVWSNWYDNLEFIPCVYGRHPLFFKHPHHAFGSYLGPLHGWGPQYTDVGFENLTNAWTQATNSTQWKRPA